MVPGVEMEEVLGAATLGVAIPWPEVERGVLTHHEHMEPLAGLMPDQLCVFRVWE